MTEPGDRYSEEMRRALSAAADLIVPSGDGLDKIRERLVHRPVPLAWFVAYTRDLPHRIFVSFRVAATGLTSFSGGGSPGAAPPPPGGRKPRFNRESSWVRPTLAAVGALAIVAIAATVVLPRLTQPVSQSAFKDNPAGRSAGSSSRHGGNASSQQNSSSGLPLGSTPPHSLITIPPSASQCLSAAPVTTSSTASPSPTDTTPSTYLSPSPAPGPTQTASSTPSPAPQSFANMIGEDPAAEVQQRAAEAGAVNCTSPAPNSGATSPVPSTEPVSTPVTTPPPSPTTTPTPTPTTTPPPTPTPTPTTQGSQSPTVPPPSP